MPKNAVTACVHERAAVSSGVVIMPATTHQQQTLQGAWPLLANGMMDKLLSQARSSADTSSTQTWPTLHVGHMEIEQFTYTCMQRKIEEATNMSNRVEGSGNTQMQHAGSPIH